VIFLRPGFQERFQKIKEEVGVIVYVMDVSLLRLNSGEIALFYGYKNSYGDSKIYVRKSFNEGKNWDEAICITPRSGYNGINNARVIQLTSGRLLAPVFIHLIFKR